MHGSTGTLTNPQRKISTTRQERIQSIEIESTDVDDVVPVPLQMGMIHSSTNEEYFGRTAALSPHTTSARDTTQSLSSLRSENENTPQHSVGSVANLMTSSEQKKQTMYSPEVGRVTPSMPMVLDELGDSSEVQLDRSSNDSIMTNRKKEAVVSVCEQQHKDLSAINIRLEQALRGHHLTELDQLVEQALAIRYGQAEEMGFVIGDVKLDLGPQPGSPASQLSSYAHLAAISKVEHQLLEEMEKLS